MSPLAAVLFCIAASAAMPVFASFAPEQSLRPQAREISQASVPPSPDLPASDAPAPPAMRTAPSGSEPVYVLSTSNVVRPMARPADVAAALADLVSERGAIVARLARQGVVTAPTSDDLAVNTPGVVEISTSVRSLRPITRPKAIVQQAMARQRAEQAGRAGGIRGVQGEAIGAVPGNGACGIDNALRVTAISGVRLSTPALLDVQTAKTLKAWVDKGLKPAIGNMGGGVEKIRVASHYACRTRNNQPGARLSEHSFGRAIDISGFTLRNGEDIILLDDWDGGSKGRALRKMHASACGKFGTVLGPEANRFHRDHFHFDTARHRSGSFCR